MPKRVSAQSERSQSTASSERPLLTLANGLKKSDLAQLLAWAAEWHGDVERRLRLAVARQGGDLKAMKAEVDRALRPRRDLGYRDTMEWAHDAQPVVDELALLVDADPSRELVLLLQRAIAHVVKALQTRVDDSSGLAGDLARELLALHVQACAAGVADPLALARWIVEFRFVQQDFFEADPVRYQTALGPAGLALYRQAVLDYAGEDDFAVLYARQRLAVLDHDIDAVIEFYGGELRNPYQYASVAQALREIGEQELALGWALEGIDRTSGFGIEQLYAIAQQVYSDTGRETEALKLLRAAHERTPTASSYAQLHRGASELHCWEIERDAALLALRERNPAALVEALLGEGAVDEAWAAAQGPAGAELGDRGWLALADARFVSDPADAVPIYLRIAETILLEANRRAYTRAIRLLKRARAAAGAAGADATFTATIADLRDRYRRRPSLLELLDKAGLTGLPGS